MTEETTLNLMQKILKAREMLAKVPLKKTGWNSYSQYYYFTYPDVRDAVQPVFDKLGLVDFVQLTLVEGTEDIYHGVLTIVDVDTGEERDFCLDMKWAAIKGQIAQQASGSTYSYVQRYLLMMVMALVEGSDVDSAVATFNQDRLSPKNLTAIKRLVERIYGSLEEAPKHKILASVATDEAPVNTWADLTPEQGKEVYRQLKVKEKQMARAAQEEDE